MANSQTFEYQSLFPTSLTCVGDFLLKFAENTTFSLWVKDIKTKKHLMNNQVCGDKWGLGTRGLEGITTREVLSRVKDFSTLEEEVKRIEQNEIKSVENNTQVHFPEVLLTYSGFVSIQTTILTPLRGAHNKPIAIVGIAQNLTKYTNFFHLLTLYQKYYPSKKQTISKFSQYLGLDRFLAEELTFSELCVMLAMTKNQKTKGVVALLQEYHPKLSLSSKTISGYISSLKEKLKPNIELQFLLSDLQNQQQWMPAVEIY